MRHGLSSPRSVAILSKDRVKGEAFFLRRAATTPAQRLTVPARKRRSPWQFGSPAAEGAAEAVIVGTPRRLAGKTRDPVGPSCRGASMLVRRLRPDREKPLDTAGLSVYLGLVERWPSGRRRSPAKGVEVKSFSRVRIPSSPPPAPAKAFSPFGCDQIFSSFSRVTQEELLTALCASTAESLS